MKNTAQMIQGLVSVVEALNSIEVRGKDNLLNLGGCIAVIEDICKSLHEQANTTDPPQSSVEAEKTEDRPVSKPATPGKANR